MKAGARVAVFGLILVAGCTADVPYRKMGFSEQPECQAVYERHEDLRVKNIPEGDLASPCWLRAREERRDYDLLVAEFDDQGWVQRSSNLARPAPDHLDALLDQLAALRLKYKDQGLAVVVFTHGWHHNADARDGNVSDFRRLLHDVALMETDGSHRRVVGLYVGWRGQSVPGWLIEDTTFWDRKNTAERVAQGSVRELFEKLDHFRDRKIDGDGTKGVRMLIIGHSFGGLITYESLSGNLIRAAARHNSPDRPVSRLGDMLVIVNPAFEGVRYEPLRVAGQRMRNLSPNQLPVVIVATSTSDWATRFAFPAARIFSTLLETTPDNEWSATVRTVGHNDRYITHRLDVCAADDQPCQRACDGGRALASDVLQPEARQSHFAMETRHMQKFSQELGKPSQNLCDGLKLQSTEQWRPAGNPFWVVQTSGEIMADHNDIFNPRFVAFVRQMYLAVVAREGAGTGGPR